MLTWNGLIKLSLKRYHELIPLSNFSGIFRNVQRRKFQENLRNTVYENVQPTLLTQEKFLTK